MGSEHFRRMVDENSLLELLVGLFGGAEDYRVILKILATSTAPLNPLTKSALSWKAVRRSSRPAIPGGASFFRSIRQRLGQPPV